MRTSTIRIINFRMIKDCTSVNIYSVIIYYIIVTRCILSTTECYQTSSTCSKWSFHLILTRPIVLNMNRHTYIKTDSNCSPETTCVKKLFSTNVVKVDGIHILVGVISNITNGISFPYMLCILSLCHYTCMGK